MRFQFALLIGAFLSATALAATICGTDEPSEEFKQYSRAFADEARKHPKGGLTLAAQPFLVNTWFHVVSSGTTLANGNVPDSQLQYQLQVLNADYGSIGIKFVLQGTTRTVNDRWATEGDELAMKKALRKGDYKTLNIYFHSFRDPKLLGHCNFPDQVAQGSDAFYLDGCSVHYSTVPGGTNLLYNLGTTATHEVGHWFGLLHPFQGGCAGGDYVSDTPAEDSPSDGCPIGRDSCTGSQYPGEDPIHNFMDYGFDFCRTHFTSGQVTRMAQMWNKFRG